MKKRLAIVGSQWGDEGKGKVVNYFAKDYEWIVRFSGGANAGHTIYVDGRKYVNHLLPSISPASDSKAFLGAGMVVDIEQMIHEIETIEKDFPGFSSRIYIDREVFLVLPWHKQQDNILEGWREKPIGTTGKGVGPAYTDKVSREGIKFYHLLDEEMLMNRLRSSYTLKKQMFGDELDYSYEDVFEYLIGLREKLKKMNVNITSAVDMADVFRNTTVLFEGAQGVLLDLDFGTYPFVTSGACMAHGVSAVGFSTFELDAVMGVLKAYTTRVGEGPYPSEELDEKMSHLLREKGNEYGATTGRPRRVGWLDLPALRYARLRSGLTEFVITKADVLNGFDEIKICTAYDVNGKIKRIPSSSYDFFVAKPIYETLKGWPNTDHINFLKYMAFIEDETGVKINYISYGPKTEEMLTKNELIRNI
ncbi:MAG TPA: adenylosuccinate synthase [Thermotogota bacterium]|nr:adenylosuccinate synthase [Thermotogota bacterium]HPJ88451.1 adenylosuccinate synthase [Thermotogota bacterium]HPR96510.1 adenylosuccinate synthase [Thermotogota bacterium]